MSFWLLGLSSEEFTDQQAFAYDSVALPGGVAAPPQDGDVVAVAGPAGVFAVADVKGGVAVYRSRADEVVSGEVESGLRQISGERMASFTEPFADASGETGNRQDWLVTLSLPVEAASKAEAVRQFWSYVRSLGPAELPTFVAPYGKELDGQAYLLGVEHEQDPEE